VIGYYFVVETKKMKNVVIFLIFTSSSDTLAIAGHTTNPYNRGQVYANTNFGSFPTYDYTFRTYSDGENVSDLPEPLSTTLLSLELTGIRFTRKKVA
jgi:hypothetical protein